MIKLKDPEEIEQMAAAGKIQARALQMVMASARPGVTTGELDGMVEKFINSQGAIPTFKGYRGFPASICASVNEMVVHGIPGPQKLESGDLLSVDIGVTYKGWVADAAVTIPIGKEIDPISERLLATTRQSLFDAVDQCQVGNHIGDVANAVQTTVESAGFSVIRELIGHGVGREMHEDPQVPNFGKPGSGPELKEGTVIAVEPMVNVGAPGIVMGDDEWSVYSADSSMTAHFEFTVAVTGDGPRILTPWHLDAV